MLGSINSEVIDKGFIFYIKEIIVNYVDILIVNLIFSGYVVFRNFKSGSRFVRCVVEVF